MKKRIGLYLMVFMLATLAACGKEEEGINTDGEMPLPLEVDLTVTEQAEVDGTIEMAAVVSQGDEKIEDADEVVFEIWEESKKDESFKIEAANEKDGLYTAETAFDHDGLFHVQVHVSARTLHTMPKKEVIVGNGGHYEEADEGEVEHEHEHEHADGFSMHFMNPENMKSGESAKLVVHLEVDGQPFEKARVRYEIWNETNPEKHDWVDVDESTAGEYATSYTFEEADTYKIQIHVEDDKELHEHEEHTLEVK
ncbi:MAG TPA: FixH family protein [Sporosarcina psychrophila]|uniref:FixH family protein n=1 Tax=Sporosarcina psychrophila TaxID=1476 RepID=A0A921FZ55_SPOPS|nr:FixH family protein [Sporosarcina psychrophila]